MSQNPYPGEAYPPRSHDNPYDDGVHGDPSGTGPYRPVPPYQQPYAPDGYHPGWYQPSYQTMEGEKAAQSSLILGIVGFFVAGLVLGPLAIWQASKAERAGVQATAGKVLGWIVTILNVLGVLGVVAFFLVVLAGVGAGYST